MSKNIKVGLDLTKKKIKNYNEYLIHETIEVNIEDLKKSASITGLDLTKNLSKKIEM
jgi:hypothetical protein